MEKSDRGSSHFRHGLDPHLEWCCFFINQGDPIKRNIPENITSWDKELIADWLKKETHTFLDMVFVTTDMPEIVKLDDEHRSGFACREIGCKAIFSLHSARKR